MDIAFLNLSVIVPTCHRNDLLALCLDRLAPGKQSLAAERYEVIVTDDGSRSTAEGLVAQKYPWARWTQGPRRGPASNRNHGARCGTAPWLVFTDDDCLPDRNFLEAFQAFIIATPGARVMEGRTYAEREKRRADEVAPINEKGGLLWSCNFAIVRSVFFEVGGFDERFPYAAMEDVELRIRLEASGNKPAFVAGASVCHPWRRSGGWAAVRKSVQSHRLFWEVCPSARSGHTSLDFLKGSVRVAAKGLREAVQFRGRGWVASFQEVILWWRLAFEALRSPATSSPRRTSR